VLPARAGDDRRHVHRKVSEMNMRASDLDRDQIVTRLRGAYEEGRLTIDEYVSRMETACQARIYGELAVLCADLPQAANAAATNTTSTTKRPTPSSFALLPGALKVLWTVWLATVSVNVVVWATVSMTGPQWVYPWPLWVAGPWGAVLLAVSASVVAGRRVTR
jgi:hypothetical protein